MCNFVWGCLRHTALLLRVVILLAFSPIVYFLVGGGALARDLFYSTSDVNAALNHFRELAMHFYETHEQPAVFTTWGVVGLAVYLAFVVLYFFLSFMGICNACSRELEEHATSILHRRRAQQLKEARSVAVTQEEELRRLREEFSSYRADDSHVTLDF